MKCEYLTKYFNLQLCKYKDECELKYPFDIDITIDKQNIYGICKKRFNEVNE